MERPAAPPADQWRVLLLGSFGGGKTTLAIRFTLDYYFDGYDPTIEEEYKKSFELDGRMTSIVITDTTGCEDYAIFREQWIRESQAVVLLYTVTSASSFSEVKIFHGLMMRVKKGKATFILVGTQCDASDREVSAEQGLALALELGCDFAETSAKMAINVDYVFHSLVRSLRQSQAHPSLFPHKTPYDRAGVVGAISLSIPAHDRLQLQFSSSRASFYSFDTLTSDVGTTTSVFTSTTVQGPGALTGRVIKALGEAELRAFRTVLITARLAVIGFSFPHSDSIVSGSVEKMYDDLLEISRLHLYAPRLRQRALQLLANQVLRKQTHYLMGSLLKWPPFEIQIFLSELCIFVNELYLNISRLTPQCEYYEYTLPLLDFICQLVHPPYANSELLLEMGFLDMILSVCILKEGSFWISALELCSTALSTCALQNETKRIILDHPLVQLWPSWLSFSLCGDKVPNLSSDHWSNPDRAAAWRRVKKELIQWRLDAISWSTEHEGVAFYPQNRDA